MAFIKYIEKIKDALDSVVLDPGQVIYCTDTNESYLDANTNSRIKLTEVIYLTKETDKELIFQPLLNKVYLVKESKCVYKYEGAWFEITELSNLLSIMLEDDEFRPTQVVKDGKNIAPVTLAECVYNDLTGATLEEDIAASDKLTLTKTKFVYVEAVRNGQKSFKIPFPLENYDFRTNYMHVVIDSFLIEPHRYVIKDDEFIVFDQTVNGLDSGQLVLFLFYYNVHVNLNDGVLLTTQNYRDESVTERKLADNAASNRVLAKNSVSLGKLTQDFKLPTDKLADRAATGIKIALKSIELTHLSDSFRIPSDLIEDDAVTSDKLAEGSVLVTHLHSGFKLPTANIADRAVTAIKIATGVIALTHLESGFRLPTVNIADSAVTAIKIATGVIALTHLHAEFKLPTVNIADRAVTSAKIALKNIELTHLHADFKLPTVNIADRSVTAIKIATGVITLTHLDTTFELPAAKVSESDTRKFVSKAMIDKWNGYWNAAITVSQSAPSNPAAGHVWITW